MSPWIGFFFILAAGLIGGQTTRWRINKYKKRAQDWDVLLRLHRGGLYTVSVITHKAVAAGIADCGEEIACNKIQYFIQAGFKVRCEEGLKHAG